MSTVWDSLAWLVVASVFGPIDRTVCRFAEITHGEPS